MQKFKELPGVYCINRNFTSHESKFVILKPENGELLMITSDTQKYHANAVLAFMKENSIANVIISGGGKFSSRKDGVTYFSGTSGSFKTSSIYDQIEVASKIERLDEGEKDENLIIEGNCKISINNGGGRNYTLSQIEYELEHA